MLPTGQLSQAVVPALPWYLPAGQFKHVDMPALFWYVPAAHFVHAVEAATANWPTAHTVQIPAGVL